MNKIENLITAIQEINDISGNLKILLDNIKDLDGINEVVAEDKKLNIPLEVMLNSGPEMIRNSCDRSHKLIEEIREILF